MAAWRLITLAYKVRRGWSRIPPAQRRQIIEHAGRHARKHARKHGPVIAKRVGEAIRQSRKGR